MSTETTNTEQRPKYSVIYVDPPWDIQQKGPLGAARHYDLLSLDAIKKMPVADLADESAHLWLWVTNATLRDGYDVMESWGFIPRSPMTWFKFKLGLGVYLRNTTEHLLFGTRGKAPVQHRGTPTSLFAPLQEHSHKPEEVFSIIERVSGPGPKLELFARRRPPFANWDVWGDQIDSDVVIPGYPVPEYSAKAERSRDD